MSLSTRIAGVISAILVGSALFASTTLGHTLHTEPELRAAIAAQMAQGPPTEGAYVVDLGDGHVVFSDRAKIARPTASLMSCSRPRRR
jgi:hypothetical protein